MFLPPFELNHQQARLQNGWVRLRPAIQITPFFSIEKHRLVRRSRRLRRVRPRLRRRLRLRLRLRLMDETKAAMAETLPDADPATIVSSFSGVSYSHARFLAGLRSRAKYASTGSRW
jgi:hypothetical protein